MLPYTRHIAPRTALRTARLHLARGYVEREKRTGRMACIRPVEHLHLNVFCCGSLRRGLGLDYLQKELMPA